MDEPTTGLDPVNRIKIWSYLENLRQREGISVILTTHLLEEATPCTRVIFLHQGKILGEGVPAHLIKTLGHYILEINCAAESVYFPQFGAGIRVGNKQYYQIHDEHIVLNDIMHPAKTMIRSLVLRQPTLEDVYLWYLPSEHLGCFGHQQVPV